MRKRSGQQMGPDPETGFPVPKNLQVGSHSGCSLPKQKRVSQSAQPALSKKGLKKKPRMQGRLSWKTRNPE